MDLNVYKITVKFISDTRKIAIPFRNKKYAPQIEINGNRMFLGSAWSLICYIYEEIDVDYYYAYIKFLNGEQAPNILYEGLEFFLCEGREKVASCKIINISNVSLDL